MNQNGMMLVGSSDGWWAINMSAVQSGSVQFIEKWEYSFQHGPGISNLVRDIFSPWRVYFPLDSHLVVVAFIHHDGHLVVS